MLLPAWGVVCTRNHIWQKAYVSAQCRILLTLPPAKDAAPSGMPPKLVTHFMELLWCVVPKIDNVISGMPSVNKHINSYKLHATARYVAGDDYQEVAHSMHRFDPVTATCLLLSEHVIPDKSWGELAKAMQVVGLADIPVYQHVAAVASRWEP